MKHLIDKEAILAEIKKIIPSEPYPRTSDTLYGSRVYGKIEMCNEIITRINSLRPQSQWKPSDEQMETLWSATEKYLESDNENVRKLRGEVLESLYEDLKKLKG